MSHPLGGEHGDEGTPAAEAESDFLYRTVVRVFVGPEERAFDIHKELVCSKSAFFTAILDERLLALPFLKGKTRNVLLPEQDARTFEHFVHWLYTSKLSGYCRPRNSPSFRDLRAEWAIRDEAFRQTQGSGELREARAARRALDCAMWEDAPPAHLASLYVLGDVLQVWGLRDHILTFMVKAYLPQPRTDEHVWTSSHRSEHLSEAMLTLSQAYDHLQAAPSGVRMRTFLVDLYVNESEAGAQIDLDDVLKMPNPAFLHECLAEARRQCCLPDDRKWDLRDVTTLCGYHLHDVRCTLTAEELVQSKHETW